VGENGSDKTIINPLASRCVECGRLIQSGSLCKTCADSKKLSKENESLKADTLSMKMRLDDMEKEMSSRKGADSTLDKLFSDPQVQELLLRKMKELKL
jgi:hypothetical protein